MTNQFKVGDRAVINWGNGESTPVIITAGPIGGVYGVKADNLPSWVNNAELIREGNRTYLMHQGHKIPVKISSWHNTTNLGSWYGAEGSHTVQLEPWLEGGTIESCRLTPALDPVTATKS